MYEGEVDESPQSLKTCGEAVENTTERKQNYRDEVDGIRETFQRYPSVIEILRKLAAQSG